MPVVQHIDFGSETSDERLAAIQLTQKLEQIDAEGAILVASNVCLPGGEDIKDVDIVVVGYLKDYHIPFSHVTDCNVNSLKVDSFCFTIEAKRHVAKNLDISELGEVSVNYKNQSKPHPALQQSLKQKYALRNTLKREKNIDVWVTNLIWMRNLEENDVPNRRPYWNILYKDFDINTLFTTAAGYNKLIRNNRSATEGILSSFNHDYLANELTDAFKLFLSKKTPQDSLSKQKFEYITGRETVQIVTDGKLNIIKGRAGTGKTLQLIKFAYQNVVENHKRCLMLTFNHALVSDIRRIAYYCDFPDGSEEAFSVQTIHSHFSQIMRDNGIELVFNDNFDKEYDTKLKELLALEEIQISEDWDYILVDEAQDCRADEVMLWKKIFGPEKIVIADGVDQFVRTITPGSWAKTFDQKVSSHELTVSKRQKPNLVSFVNKFAAEAGIHWSVKEDNKLHGGEVIITNRYNKELHDETISKHLSDMCSMYDMLLLVDSTLGSPEKLPTIIKNLKKMGLEIFDGTTYDNRSLYPINPKECRLYNYNSCRGIEGWTVVCVNLDKLIEEKMKYAQRPPKKEYESEEEYIERQERLIYKWLLMPMTRAIDKLIITLNDKDSKVGKMLKRIHESSPDYIHWKF